jgi:hypothetical protein
MSWSQIRFSLLSLQEETRSARTAFHLPPVAHAQGVPGFTLVLLVPLGHSCSLVIFPVRVSAARTLLFSAFFVSSPREGRSQSQCYRCLVLICSVAAATVRVIFPQLRSSVDLQVDSIFISFPRAAHAGGFSVPKFLFFCARFHGALN